MDITNLQHSSWEIRNDAEEIALSELAYIFDVPEPVGSPAVLYK